MFEVYFSADDSDDDAPKEKDLAKSSGNLRNTMFGGISKKSSAPVKDNMIEVKRSKVVPSQCPKVPKLTTKFCRMTPTTRIPKTRVLPR